MQATIHYSQPGPVRPRPIPVRHRITMDELLRRASDSVDRGEVKLISGRFRPVVPGRSLTRLERALMLLLAGGLVVAVWLRLQPAPVSAYAAHYQALAATTGQDSASPRIFTEGALRTLGSDWRPETLFASVQPDFWNLGPAIHPDLRARRIEGGLARLAGHGPVVGVTVFEAAPPVATETINGAVMVTCRLSGQLELADGIVVRFAVRLGQDGQTRRWGIVELSVPPFLP